MYRRKLSSIVKEYFSFTSGERRGIFVLFVIILLSIGVRISLPYFMANRAVVQTPHKNRVQTEAKDSSYKKYAEKRKKINDKGDKLPNTLRTVSINSCDTATLETLPGIGPVLSRRIIKYRELLGGYYAKDQMLEVFGMTDENYNRFVRYITIDTLKIRKLNLNTATFKEINAHPYISYEQTKAIFKLRSKSPKLNREHILKCEAFDSIQKIKVLTYLQFH